VDNWIKNENTFEELKIKLNEILDKENENN